MSTAADRGRSEEQRGSDGEPFGSDGASPKGNHAISEQYGRRSNDGDRPVQVLLPAALPALTLDGALALLRILRRARQRSSESNGFPPATPVDSTECRRRAA